ncbi:hypothetical protein J6590_069567 [Homalodisca vitripennis]|nr:hypothetical protein J6590_069565 [Homalodisca vitripennis]KAG8256395.1 hypothetical protein J6590_069567 [Homalodisca vitripennis]
MAISFHVRNISRSGCRGYIWKCGAGLLTVSEQWFDENQLTTNLHKAKCMALSPSADGDLHLTDQGMENLRECPNFTASSTAMLCCLWHLLSRVKTCASCKENVITELIVLASNVIIT